MCVAIGLKITSHKLIPKCLFFNVTTYRGLYLFLVTVPGKLLSLFGDVFFKINVSVHNKYSRVCPASAPSQVSGSFIWTPVCMHVNPQAHGGYIQPPVYHLPTIQTDRFPAAEASEGLVATEYSADHSQQREEIFSSWHEKRDAPTNTQVSLFPYVKCWQSTQIVERK